MPVRMKFDPPATVTKALLGLPPEIQERLTANADRSVARKVRQQAKLLVPVASGNLRDSIRVSTRRGRVSVRAGGRNARQAFLIESGHVSYGPPEGTRYSYRGREYPYPRLFSSATRQYVPRGSATPGHSFIVRGAELTRPFMVAEYQKSLQRGLRRISRKAAKEAGLR